MEIIIIALLFFFAMSIITFGLAWLITKKERQTFKLEQNQNLLVQFQKAAKGFKIATIISAPIPLLPLIPFLFDEPTHSSGDDLLKFFIVLSMIMLILPVTSVFSYNYLFFTSNDMKAFYILLTPFIPIFIIGSFIISVGGEFIGILLMLPYVIILAVMANILYSKRQQFNAKRNNQ